MIKRSGIKKSMLLLLGCIVLLTGCAEDKKIIIEKGKQDIVQNGLSDDNDAESIPEENVSEFPEDMFIPDPAKAELPELSHFKDKYYFRKREEYSDTESDFFEYRNLPGELIISCDNRETAISCFIYVVEDKYYYQDFRGTAYKQDDSNLYVGDICPVTDSDTVIGKFIISYSTDELILSVGYFDDTSDEQEKILESGVYHYYYNMTEFEKESVVKMGNPVELTDYSDYSGTWFPVYPADVVVQGREIYTYMELEIDSAGKVSGCMSQYEGLSKCSYAEFTENIEGSGCVIKYDDDGYGHEGTLTFTFYENGIGVYIDEGGEPNGHGFPTGHNYYMKQEVQLVAPTKEEVLSMRELVLGGMSEKEIDRLRENIKIANQQMEYAYLYDNIFAKLEDKESPYWNYFDDKGDIKISATETVYNRFNAENFINLLEEMKTTVQNEGLQNDLQQIIDQTALAAETHEMKYANNIYKLLHDMDYYLLRYGPEDVGKYTQDASVAAKYYGVLKVYAESSEVHDLCQLPLAPSLIEGFAFVDGMEKPVSVTLGIGSIQRGEEAYETLQKYDSDIISPNENEEYIIVTFNVSYDSGAIEELYMMENKASLEQAGLYFALSNGQSNAYDVTSYLSNSIYDISLTKGQSAQGAVAFLQEKGNTEPLVFVGFEQTVRFDIN